YNSLNGGDKWEGYGDFHDSNAQYANGFVDITDDDLKNFHICYATERDATIGTPGIRYAKIKNNAKEFDVLVTKKNEIEAVHLKLGLGSVAASADGQFVMITYITSQDGGQLCARLSTDGGRNWGDREVLAEGINSLEGRSRQFIRAKGHRFYLVYPHKGIQFRYYQIPGFDKPTVKANGPYNGKEGSSITFNAAGSKDPGGIVMFAWDWNNDGNFDDSTSSEQINHTFPDDYQGKVALRVRNSKGTLAIDYADVTIANVAPVVTFSEGTAIKEGDLINILATVTDPGTNDVLRYFWDFGDGQTSNEPKPQHAYSDNGTFQLKLTVSDDDGGQTTAEKTISVTNVPPVAEAGGPYRARSNQEIEIRGEATDPGKSDILSCEWDFNGDGTYEKSGQVVKFKSDVDGNFKIILKVKDDDGGESTDQATIVVGSAAPKIAPIPSQTIKEGAQFKTIKLDNYLSDPDDPLEAITWNSSGNIYLEVSISNRIAQITTPNENWNGEEIVMFTATDQGGESDTSLVTFTVTSVNDPPQLLSISSQSTNEGKAFKPIQLDQYTQDIDHNSSQMIWEITGNINLKKTIENRVLTIAPIDSEWAGTEKLTFKVTDPESASAQLAVNFTVLSINDPPRIKNLANLQCKQFSEFEPINLDTCAFDPDNSKDQLTWSFTGNTNLNITISNFILKIQVRDKNWSGTENIVFTLKDPEGRQDSRTINVTVIKVDARPTILAVPDQTIDEGEIFNPINFDEYVTDKNNSVDEINWICQGQKNLLVKWNQHVLKVEPPDKEWSGSEKLTIIASDITSLKDTTTITFTVQPINDSPTISGISDISFDEDSRYELQLSELRQFAFDVDDEVSKLSFGIRESENILWEMLPTRNVLKIYTRPDFCGTENVLLFVSDPAGSIGTQPITITVNPIPDPLKPFTILRPLNQTFFAWTMDKEFAWTQAIDPDPDDVVVYFWLLSRTATFADTFHYVAVGTDTVYTHHVSKRMYKGEYFWKVLAYSTDGTQQVSPVGRITATITDVAFNESVIPENFELMPNFPNPFNPETRIKFNVAEESVVTIQIYNALGQKIRELIRELKAPGTYEIAWDAKDDTGHSVTSGLYICQFQAKDKIYFRKMVFMQ
ncbi:PKD domain-containing protein, partial [candidate division KSB1 bacterium]|nr:PKD domain-containing protein [candidate division KSB1 bacterium]